MTWSRVSAGFGAAAAGGALVAVGGEFVATVVSALGGVTATVFALPPLGAGAGAAAAVVAGGTVA